MLNNAGRSLAEFGLRMPAEWEPHKSTFIVWPNKHAHLSWPGRNKLKPIPGVFTEIVRHLHESERVDIIVWDNGPHRNYVQNVLRTAGIDLNRIGFCACPTVWPWIRDTGPIFVKNGGIRIGTLWRFNAWGDKYPNRDQGESVNACVAKFAGVPCHPVIFKRQQVVLEGGAIDVDGKGNLIATEECLLDQKIQARNPGVSREKIEEILKHTLGLKLVTWLKRGIRGDDTHGHIDDVARFLPTGLVALVADPDSYRENLERLEDHNLESVKIPMPDPPVVYQGQTLPASYANFYIANTKVLVPIFRRKTDDLALEILRELFVDREIVPIDCTNLVWGLGTIHCLTQQVPRA